MVADELLNFSLDLPPLAASLRQQGSVRVDDFFQPDFATELRDCLLNEVPWTLAYRAAGQARTIAHEPYLAMTDAQLSRLHREVHEQASAGFAFLYDSYMMIPAYLEQRNPQLLLHAMVEVLNSPVMLKHLATLTGDAEVTKLDGQATRYLPGHFLKFHNDLLPEENRRFAFVLNLSQSWQADWGGLLQLLDGPAQVVQTLMPRFNSLTLFRVPSDHCVSMVAPFASAPRLAITGWLRA